MAAIEIENFSKSYAETMAVKNLDLQVQPGELFGLIGPDGAGKTTLMRAVCTLLEPDDGHILVNGLDVIKDTMRIRSILGYMPQRFSLYMDLTVEQNLMFFADLFQVPKSEREGRLSRLYRFSRLEPFRKRAAGDLSGGMKQKLALSCALIHTPDILVLDEPTFGVDPVSRDEFWQILYTIRDQGTTILVSTAYMDEADKCDRIALFFGGEIKALDTPEKLKNSFPYPLYKLEAEDLFALASRLTGDKAVHSVQMFGDSLHVSFYNEPDKKFWSGLGLEASARSLQRVRQAPSIEDVFLNRLGK